MIYKHFIFILLIFSTTNGWSNNLSKDSIINNVFSSIYNQQFKHAKDLLVQNQRYIDPFYTEILNIDLHWWKYSTTRSKKDAKEFNALLITSENKNGNKAEDKISQLIKKSYRLRYERKRYNIIQVVILRSEIDKLLTEINSVELDIVGDQLKLFDLYITMFKYFKDVNPLYIRTGSERQSSYLDKMGSYSLDDDLVLNTMAHYFLGRIYQKVKKDGRRGKMHFEILTKKFPENKLFVEYLEDCEKNI